MRGPHACSGRVARVLAWTVLVMALLALVAKILPQSMQNNAVWIALLLPPHLVLACRLLRAPAPPAGGA